MAGAPIKGVNEGIDGIFNIITADPIVDRALRFKFIAFNDTARVLMPLTELSDVNQIPVCHAGGSASYAAAFRLLKSEIQTDVSKLRQNYIVRRPLVVFASMGLPNNDGWKEELARLTSDEFEFRPHVASLGFPGADREVIAQVAHWVNKSGRSPYFLATGPRALEFVMNELLKFFLTAVIADLRSDGLEYPLGASIGNGEASVHMKDKSEFPPSR